MAEHGAGAPAAGPDAPLASLMALFAAMSAASLQRRFVTDPDFPADPNALPLLIDLATRGPQRPSVIADRLHVSAPTATRLVQKLVAAGLASRSPDPADARATLVELSPAGERLAREVLGGGERLMERVLEGWSSEEVASLTSSLARLAGDVARHLDELP